MELRPVRRIRGTFSAWKAISRYAWTARIFGHLVFLPSGDAALTRRARKASKLSAVVVQFSRTRKRSERQGVLSRRGRPSSTRRSNASPILPTRGVDVSAIAEYREKEDSVFQAALAAEIRRLFPGFPTDRANLIAESARSAWQRSSGEVHAAGRASRRKRGHSRGCGIGASHPRRTTTRC